MALNKSQGFFVKIIVPAFVLVILLLNLGSKKASIDDQVHEATLLQDHRQVCLLLLEKSRDNGISVEECIDLIDAYHELAENDKAIVDHALDKSGGWGALLDQQEQRTATVSSTESNVLKSYLSFQRGLPNFEYIADLQADTVLRFNFLMSQKIAGEKQYCLAAEYAQLEFDSFPEQRSYDNVVELLNGCDSTQLQVDFISKHIDLQLYSSNDRLYVLENGSFGTYFKMIYSSIYNGNNLLMLFISFCITLVWGWYFYKLKFFYRKNWSVFVGVFIASVVFCELTIFFMDGMEKIGLTEGEDVSGMIWFYIAGVGFVEESVKLIAPLIVILVFKKHLKEPLDYMLLGVFSGLAFAFGENVLYFNRSAGSIDLRALTATFMHIMTTSIVLYGWVYKMAKKPNGVYAPFFFFTLAVLIHAFYDVLIELNAILFLVLLIALFFVLVNAWVKFLGNAINFSPFFKTKYIPSNQGLIIPLMTGLIVVLLIEYGCKVLLFSVEAANEGLKGGTVVSLLLLLIFVYKLSRLVVVKGVWEKFDLYNVYSFAKKDEYLGMHAKITLLANQVNSGVLQGEVIHAVQFENKRYYYVVLLKEQLLAQEKMHHHLIISLSKRGSDLYDKNVLVEVRLSESEQWLSDNNKRQYPLYGVAKFNEILIKSSKT